MADQERRKGHGRLRTIRHFDAGQLHLPPILQPEAAGIDDSRNAARALVVEIAPGRVCRAGDAHADDRQEQSTTKDHQMIPHPAMLAHSSHSAEWKKSNASAASLLLAALQPMRHDPARNKPTAAAECGACSQGGSG
ncbi:hypothetical protein JQ615_25500 [Bradyrhizobium jicamae]|uniref:Transposase DDE domain-containing protein n=1 Tax=Bradyrhizobium jicamae TaxID=280332 RepID=A0ABS5FPP3_9BRAD|nr:hypothetical protein [Bradyrhizobium jicamae]